MIEYYPISVTILAGMSLPLLPVSSMTCVTRPEDLGAVIGCTLVFICLNNFTHLLYSDESSCSCGSSHVLRKLISSFLLEVAFASLAPLPMSYAICILAMISSVVIFSLLLTSACVTRFLWLAVLNAFFLFLGFLEYGRNLDSGSCSICTL